MMVGKVLLKTLGNGRTGKNSTVSEYLVLLIYIVEVRNPVIQ